MTKFFNQSNEQAGSMPYAIAKCFRLTILLLLGGSSCAALTACSSSSAKNPDLPVLYSLLRHSMGNGRVTLSEAAAIPYATIGVRIGGGPEAIATLATDTGQERLWALGEKIAVVTDPSGRIQRTAGLGHDLTWSVSQTDMGHADTYGKQKIWSADFADLQIFSAQISCRRTTAGKTRIIILGSPIATTQIIEQCECPQLNWRFTDRYWIDTETNLPWRSIQYVHPNLDPIEIEVLRPPS